MRGAPAGDPIPPAGGSWQRIGTDDETFWLGPV